MNKERTDNYQNIKEIEQSVILSSPIRMTIMLILQQHKRILLTEIQKLLNETSGNIDYHIKKLEKENLIIKRPSFFKKRVLNEVEITTEGLERIKLDMDLFKQFLDNFNKLGSEKQDG